MSGSSIECPIVFIEGSLKHRKLDSGRSTPFLDTAVHRRLPDTNRRPVCMTLCLFEDKTAAHLAPLTHTRAVHELRCGMHTLGATLQRTFPHTSLALHTRQHLEAVVAARAPRGTVNRLPTDDEGVLFVHGGALPAPGWVDAVTASVNEATARVFTAGSTLIAAWWPDPHALPADLLSNNALPADAFSAAPVTDLGAVPRVTRTWHLMDALRGRLDQELGAAINASPSDAPLHGVHASAVVDAPEQVYLAPGASVGAGAILNAENGPIYIDSEAAVLEQAVVRGPIYIGPQSQIKRGADVEGSSFGTYSKIGGEVHDCIVQGYSNKGHAGFLGHSILGEWCNLGADTNTSNLKNDYGTVSVYDAAAAGFVDTGRQFMGLVMGDHSKCGINTMFNTGTVVGTGCNVYDSGFPPRYLPSFSWGSPHSGFVDYRLDKALSVAARVMARRDKTLTAAQEQLLTRLFEKTAPQRVAMRQDG